MSIPVLTLREAVSYNKETGLFVWRERPIHHFKNDSKWSAADCQSRWNGRYAGLPAFETATAAGYLMGRIDNQPVLAHRAAWAYITGQWPSQTIDHRNGVRTDNRLANLREATRQEQSRNVAANKTGSSQFLGVSYRKDRGVWRANIFLDGKQTSLGTFKDEEEAARAYDAAAAQHFGEFARLNFPHGIHSALST